ncbi:hypothetical protein D3C71_1991300 [compost metagenome]
MIICIVVDHQIQLQLPGPLLRDGHTDQTSGLADHKIDCLWRCLVRQHNKVSLVLPVLVVHYQNRLAQHQVIDRFLNAIQRLLLFHLHHSL